MKVIQQGQEENKNVMMQLLKPHISDQGELWF